MSVGHGCRSRCRRRYRRVMRAVGGWLSPGRRRATSGTARFRHRGPEVPIDRCRDPRQPRSVHLSGGTSGRDVPPDRSCPAGTPQQCRRLAGCRLLDRVRTEQLARLFGNPAMDCGWGLRGLGAKEAGHNPFGLRSGAVRVHETAVAVAGLTAAGYEEEANSHCAEPRRRRRPSGTGCPRCTQGCSAPRAAPRCPTPPPPPRPPESCF